MSEPCEFCLATRAHDKHGMWPGKNIEHPMTPIFQSVEQVARMSNSHFCHSGFEFWLQTSHADLACSFGFCCMLLFSLGTPASFQIPERMLLKSIDNSKLSTGVIMRL